MAISARQILSKIVKSRKCLSTAAISVRKSSSSSYHSEKYSRDLHRSLTVPEEYWAEISENTVWTRQWDKVLDNSNPPFVRWFVGGELSMCYNAVDRHVDEGHGDQAALVWDSPITESKRTITFRELQSEVSRVAGLLSRLGVEKGDRVMVYMPMIPEAVISMLAIVRLGAVHSVVFGGFAAKEVAVRIKHCQPKVIISASCGLEPGRVVQYKPNVDEAIRLSGGPVASLVFQSISRL